MYPVWNRLALSVFSVLFAVTLSFFLIHLIPGSPVDLMLGDQASQMDKLALEKSLGLDKSLWKQYVSFLSKFFKGDLSTSFYTKQPVLFELKKALWPTFLLALSSLFLAVLWGVPLGLVSALNRKKLDKALSFLSLSFMSVPVFVTAPLFIWLFVIRLSWLPVSEVGESFKHVILPAFSLCLPLGAVLLKMTRSSMLQTLQMDFIKTARAKGLSLRHAEIKHGFSNALTPVISILGLQTGALLSGTIIVEKIFDWPGVGLLLLTAIQSRDYPLVQGTVLLISLIYIFVNVFIDLLYIVVQPRLRT